MSSSLNRKMLIWRIADWVSEFAPKKLQKALSYIIGMVTIFKRRH